MPESFSEHAKIFATLTAPSFGSVHRIIRQNAKYERCHAGKSEICPHSVKLNCYRRHTEKDENVGAPLCAECYDFEGAAIWNASVTDLWRYTTIYFKRELAKMFGLSGAEFRNEARIEYIKVVEYQARGLIHLHVVVRVDAADSKALSPGVTITSEMLEIALKIAARKVCIEKDFDSNCYRIAWGSQLDTRPIIGDATKAVVNYLAKYSTKSSSESTGFDRRFKSSADIEKLEAPEHLKELARTAFRLGNDARYAPLNLAHWAHDLGHRGHFLTKSRRFSLTFAHLRFIRQLWRMQQVMESASDDSAWRPLGFNGLCRSRLAVACTRLLGMGTGRTRSRGSRTRLGTGYGRTRTRTCIMVTRSNLGKTNGSRRKTLISFNETAIYWESAA